MKNPALPLRVLLLQALFILAFPTLSSTAPPPFFPHGEKLTFQIRWSFLLAGHATLEVRQGEIIDGETASHFVMTTRTTPFIDTFYKVRDVIESYTSQDMHHSLRYIKKQQGKTKRDIIVTFDWKKNQARYANFGKPKTPIPIPPGTIDPLAALYFIRQSDFNHGPLIERPVTDGKYNEIGKAKILRREEVHVPAGIFQTIVVQPNLAKVRGVFEKDKNSSMLLWITDDRSRRLVKVASKVKVGSFVAELIASE
ncbi:MAG: hypothetical protein BM485_04620 [Desulfobulbaceae bacterium DB1]|nr:MAG: hypothetical protein BM485_04620 [Desulfobulbaceae bacterium DB1]